MTKLTTVPIDFCTLQIPDNRGVDDFWLDLYPLCAITAADDLGFFDTLNRSPSTPRALAILLKTDERVTDAVLRILSIRQLVHPLGDVYCLTAEAQAYWVSTSPLYRARSFRKRRTHTLHQRIVQACREGWVPLLDDESTLSESWKNGQVSEKAAEHFAQEMHSLILGPAIAASRSGAFKGVRHILDAGGGCGTFSLALAAHIPLLRATIFDLPSVAAIADRFASEQKLGGQVSSVAGDFFSHPWPRGHDSVLLSNILHDWPRETGASLLRSAYESLPSGGRLFVHEVLLDELKLSPTAAVIFDLIVLISHKGQQYTRTELETMLRHAGFEQIELAHRFGYYTLVVATKP